MLLSELLNKEEFNAEELDFLLNITSKDDLELLFRKSLGIKNLYLGRFKNKIASIQFSNYCQNDCLYCNLREDSIYPHRYRLSPEEILEITENMVNENITNLILQSGADNYYDTDMISYLIYKIKKDFDVEITLDLVERRFDEYRAWKFAGADNYLLKFNTANENNYSFFSKSDKLSERLNHIKYLKRIGYKICTGNIIGLPYQTKNDIVNDLLLLKSINPEMILNSPFIPKEFTKFQNWPKPEFNMIKKVIAISRILLKKSDILISNSSDLFKIEEKKELFNLGANTLILEYYNFENRKYEVKIPVKKNQKNTLSKSKSI